MAVVIRILGVRADFYPPDAEPMWLEDYDIEFSYGLGRFWQTAALADALKFDTAAVALTAWQTQSTVRPLRSDGKPNRPLTALSVEVVTVEDAERLVEAWRGRLAGATPQKEADNDQ